MSVIEEPRERRWLAHALTTTGTLAALALIVVAMLHQPDPPSRRPARAESRAAAPVSAPTLATDPSPMPYLGMVGTEAGGAALRQLTGDANSERERQGRAL